MFFVGAEAGGFLVIFEYFLGIPMMKSTPLVEVKKMLYTFYGDNHGITV